MQKKPFEPDSYYEERRIAPRWRKGVLPSAGIYLLDDAYHVAVPGTPAERALAERGALLVAGVRFDGQPMEPQLRDARVVSLVPAAPSPLGHKRTLERQLGWTPTRN